MIGRTTKQVDYQPQQGSSAREYDNPWMASTSHDAAESLCEEPLDAEEAGPTAAGVDHRVLYYAAYVQNFGLSAAEVMRLEQLMEVLYGFQCPIKYNRDVAEWKSLLLDDFNVQKYRFCNSCSEGMSSNCCLNEHCGQYRFVYMFVYADFPYPSATHKIFDHIFNGYNRHVRPVRNISTTTVVYMDNGLRSIIHTDEVNQVLVLKEWLRMFWRDEFLVWNPDDFDGIDEIKVPRSLIWLPDVTRIDVLEHAQSMTDDRSFVLLDHTGFIRHSVDHVVRVFCNYKISMFPFDRQNCTIHYEPWHSTYKEVFIEVHPEADVRNYRPSNEWDLLSYTARIGLGSYPPILSQPTSRAYYDIVIKRRPHYYVACFMLPCFIIMELSLLGLFSPSSDTGEHSEKVTMGLTSLLSMTILLLMISENLPKTNESLPILGFFVLVEILIGTLATATTVYVSHMQSSWRRDKKVPAVLMALARFQFCRRIHRNDSNAELFAEDFRQTNSILKKDSLARCDILAHIGNFERNMNVISANLQKKAAQKRLRMRWVRVCERIDSLLLVFFLLVNSLFFAVLLIVGYLSN
ncbi:hypothetical protein Q1695_003059 [Nippostrongylus brasiliensis]|nr:hypothetical protein Q1695_003059 [Nippostrongylus brasiliensis]